MIDSLEQLAGRNISLIAAMDQNHVIGTDNQMPWHLPDDLKFFKAQTLDKPVIMGRKTFESIGSKALPKRRNIVISRNANYSAEGAEVYTSVVDAINSCGTSEEVIIMGGGQLYRQLLPVANKLYVTLVNAEVDGDTVFPKWTPSEWQLESSEFHEQDEKHSYSFEFLIFLKK